MFVVLRILGWGIAGVCYAAGGWVALCLLLFLLTSAGWPLIPVALIGYAITTGRLRRRRGDAALRYVEQAVRLGLPLAPMMQAAAASESGLLRARLEALSQRLYAGDDLTMGLRAEVPEVTPRAASLVAVGEETGRLAPLLGRLREESRIEDERRSMYGPSTWGYPLIVTGFMTVVVVFLVVFIVPKYIEIFEDFDQALPAVTVTLLGVVRWLGGPLLPGTGEQVVPGLVWVFMGMAVVVALGLAMQTALGRAWAAPLWWYAPVAHGLQRDRGLADACHVVESALGGGEPVEAALTGAARLRVNPVLRQRLGRWAERVAAGEEIGTAARRAKLPGLVAGMASIGAVSGSLAEAFGFLRRFYDGRFSRAAALLSAAATPATVLVLAVLVGWIVLAMFVPLVVLIESLLPGGWTA